jgi:ankyrin repeat protein
MSESSQHPVVRAAQRGDVQMLLALLPAYPLKEWYKAAVWVAACNDHVPVIEVLCTVCKLNLNKNCNEFGWRPLWAAARYGSAAAAQLLVRAKADAKCVVGHRGHFTHKWPTAAMVAARYGHVHVLRALAQEGVDIHGWWGTATLQAAVEFGHTDVVEELLRADAKAEKDAENKPATKPVTKPATKPVTKPAKKPATKLAEKLEAAHTAASTGRCDILQRLVMAGVSVNSLTQYMRTLLHTAAIHDRANVVRWLVRAKADVNLQSYEGDGTAAHCAANCGHTSIVGTLVRAKVHVDTRDKQGRTLTIVAADHGQGRTVALLLRCKADVDLRDQRGRTPFTAELGYSVSLQRHNAGASEAW